MNSKFIYETKVGDIVIEDNGSGITRVDFVGEGESRGGEFCESELNREARKQIGEYLEGERKFFELPLVMEGTEFQKKVWEALMEIPWGETRSYKEIAIVVGNVKASRAVGMANNKNPIAIIVPCHRVIGANGKLVGYAGGLEIKERLLVLERAVSKDGYIEKTNTGTK